MLAMGDSADSLHDDLRPAMCVSSAVQVFLGISIFWA